MKKFILLLFFILKHSKSQSCDYEESKECFNKWLDYSDLLSNFTRYGGIYTCDKLRRTYECVQWKYNNCDFPELDYWTEFNNYYSLVCYIHGLDYKCRLKRSDLDSCGDSLIYECDLNKITCISRKLIEFKCDKGYQSTMNVLYNNIFPCNYTEKEYIVNKSINIYVVLYIVYALVGLFGITIIIILSCAYVKYRRKKNLNIGTISYSNN